MLPNVILNRVAALTCQNLRAILAHITRRVITRKRGGVVPEQRPVLKVEADVQKGLQVWRDFRMKPGGFERRRCVRCALWAAHG